MSNVTTIHRDPENRAKDASNSIVLKANIFLFENSFSMLQANIFLIESSLSNVTTIHRENPKIRAHDASTTMLRQPLVELENNQISVPTWLEGLQSKKCIHGPKFSQKP